MFKRLKKWLWPDLQSPSEEFFAKAERFSDDFDDHIEPLPDGEVLYSGKNDTCSWTIISKRASDEWYLEDYVSVKSTSKD